MKKLNAIIVDDEKHARESLTALLELYCPEVNVIAKAANIAEGKKMIESLTPDVVFLDIAIGEDNGFDLVELLSPISFQLIFTTAFSDFALKAFRVNAIDYLLKPIDPEQLTAAVTKAHQNKNPIQLQEQLTHLFDSLQSKQTKKIAISTLEGVTFVEVEHIVHVSGSGNYSTFHLETGNSIMASKSLKYFETLLPEGKFFRSHQSHLVNLTCIKSIVSSEGVIELSNGEQAPLSKSRKEDLMKVMLG